MLINGKKYAITPYADLRDANLQGAKGISTLAIAQMSFLPEGDLIGYKKLAGGVICKLLIPAGALRSHATGRKCRASHAIVREGEGFSASSPTFRYRVGERVDPELPFDLDRWEECASGIHFFITREEAEAY